jgi:SOS response associated peptidase (SRAP)
MRQARAPAVRGNYRLPELVPRYNIAPAQFCPIVIATEEGKSIHVARWGLVPSWSRDLSLGAGMINAPAETLDQKPAYRTVFDAQREPGVAFFDLGARPGSGMLGIVDEHDDLSAVFACVTVLRQ